MSPPDSPHEKDRVSSREGLRFLTRAGRVLSGSLDPATTLERLARLAVPRVACFAMIDLVHGAGRLERVAFKHIDEKREPLLDRPGPFLPEEEGLVPLARVLASGQAMLIEDAERDWTGSAEVLERIRKLDGRSLMLVPLVASGEVLGVLTFGSTRTDRFYHRDDLTLARELARSASLAIENARLYRKAEQAIAARDEMLGVVSHDLRNPVTRVQAAAELMIMNHDLPPEVEETAEMIVAAAAEMDRLVDDLLDVAQIEAGRLSVRLRPTTLRDLLDRLRRAHAHAAEKQGLDWDVEMPADDVAIMVDESRMLQALGNLAGNALKFTPEGGTVRVSATRTDGMVRIAVRDTGPGMDEAQLAHVFDRFWQSDSGDRRGAGLGLAIARGILEAHGGRIGMESRLGVGTTAWVEVPVDARSSPQQEAE